MSRWTSFDPDTGIVETCTYDEMLDQLVVTKSQDCSALLDRNKELRATRACDEGKRPENVRLYCSIPVGVQYELLQKYHINIADRNHWPRLFDVINKDYPYLKTTDLTHAFRNGSRRVFKTSSKPTSSP